MLKEIKLPLNTSLLELITVSFFFAIGYSILYKYSFYKTLGIDWYVYSLTPNYIVFSSVKMLFNLLVGVLLGIFLFRNMNSSGRLVLSAIFMFILLLLNLLFFKIYPEVSVFSRKEISIFLMGVALINLLKYTLTLYKKYPFDSFAKFISAFYLVFLFVIIILIPASLGKSEAKYVKENLGTLDDVELNNEKIMWRILELNNDKLMLITETKENKLAFKIVEYKDVKIITAK